MKNERLLIVTVSVVIGSGCLAFGLSTDDYQSLKIAEDAEVIEEVTVVKDKPVEANSIYQGTGIVREVNKLGVLFVDIDTGEMLIKYVNGNGCSLEPGDVVEYVRITTPNGNEIIQFVNGSQN